MSSTPFSSMMSLGSRRMGLGAMVLSCLFGGPATRSQTFSDGTFAGWTERVFLSNTGAATQSVQGTGNPGLCLLVSTVTQASGAAPATTGIAVWNAATPAVWNPVTQGPIASVAMNVDFVTHFADLGYSQSVGLLAVQGQRVFVSPLRSAFSITGWSRFVVPPRSSAGFSEIILPYNWQLGAHPDFSASAPSVMFGFFCSGFAPATTRTLSASSFDNWRVTVVPAGQVALSGAGCPGSNGTPTIGNDGFPGLGFSRFGLTLSQGPRSAAAALMVGLSDTSWNKIPLPLDLVQLGMPGCLLRTSTERLTATATDASGAARVSMVVPNDPALINQRVHAQWLALDPQANAAGVTLSGLATCTIE